MYSFPIFSDWHEFSIIILDLLALIHCSYITVIETVVPCREHYFILFHFILYISCMLVAF